MKHLPLEQIKEIEVPKPLNETQRILTEALTRLGPNGENWCKGELTRGGSYCAIGAQMIVEFGTTDVGGTQCGLSKAWRKMQSAAVQLGYEGVGHFNDQADTKFADIHALYQLAIELAA